jgi:hypothetical protein
MLYEVMEFKSLELEFVMKQSKKIFIFSLFMVTLIGGVTASAAAAYATTVTQVSVGKLGAITTVYNYPNLKQTTGAYNVVTGTTNLPNFSMYERLVNSDGVSRSDWATISYATNTSTQTGQPGYYYYSQVKTNNLEIGNQIIGYRFSAQ